MASWAEHACAALTVYYERGVRAVELMTCEEWEQADTVLNLRRAAFYNFRSMDHLALREGYPPEKEQRLQEVWKKIVTVDDVLLRAMETARDQFEKELVRIKKVQKTLSRFRSGDTQQSSLEEVV